MSKALFVFYIHKLFFFLLSTGNNSGENFPQEFLIQIYERIQKAS